MSKNVYYDYWLSSKYVNDDLKDQMLKMSPSEIDIAFSNKPINFGTAGYRAKMGPGMVYLNENTYKQLTIAYAKFILTTTKNKHPVIFVGHDNRLNGVKYTNLIAAILTSMGFIVVFHEGNLPIPTPMVSYIVRKHNMDGAINITASHNPKEYNGFKVFDRSGSQLSNSEVETLKRFIPAWDQCMPMKFKPVTKNIKFLTEKTILSYFKDVQNHVGINHIDKDDEPIIFVSHHGTASLLKVINFLKSQGHNITPVYSQSYLDENFINSQIINPEDEGSFKEAIKLAEKKKANVIIGLDPDADRLAMVVKDNGKWVYLNGNENGILATYYLLKYKDYGDNVPTVISTHVSNNLINKIVNEQNGLVLRSGVGFKNIATLMNSISSDKRISFVVAFEEAVGLCISDSIREKDGIAAALLMLEMYKFYKQKNMTLIDLLRNQIYERYGNWIGKTISYKIKGENWKNKVDEIMHRIAKTNVRKFGQFKVKRIQWNNEAKCLEILFDDNQSWIKFRASGTEPKFKIYYNLYFESDEFMWLRSYQMKLDALNKINDEIISLFKIN